MIPGVICCPGRLHRETMNSEVKEDPLGGSVDRLVVNLSTTKVQSIRRYCHVLRLSWANSRKVVAGMPVSLRTVRLGKAEKFQRTTR